jgi:adenosylcobinamide kinase/adenosylcobinamide-phosphate guanylyltransferase
MALITLITGGARSGKSSFALRLALEKGRVRTFIATAVAFDEEMAERISRHQKERGDRFRTVEEPIHLSDAIGGLPADNQVVVVDCLTVWLGNLYHHYKEDRNRVLTHVQAFINRLDDLACDLILVTNEVGWGIVPESPLARSFRDVAGYLNRRVAEKAQHVYLLCCGIPLTLKGSSTYE